MERNTPSFILGRTPTHIYLAPHPLLRQAIAHYTFMPSVPHAMPENLSLIPDASGCIVLIKHPDCWKSFFWGPTTKVVTVISPAGTAPEHIFIEFHPRGARRLTGLNICELKDLRIELELLSPALSNELYQSAETFQSLFQLKEQLDHIFLSRLLPATPSDTVSEFVCASIHHSMGTLDLKELAAQTGYSQRHLSRLAAQSLGLTLKSYLRLVRINRATLLLPSKELSLTNLAQQLGYFDQSHFIHDFRNVCGVTPTQYRQNMSFFYNETYKF